MEELKIIQIIPVTTPTWVKWLPMSCSDPKTGKPSYEQVAVWALVEHKNGKTRVYGMTLHKGDLVGMNFCERTLNFGGYTYTDPKQCMNESTMEVINDWEVVGNKLISKDSCSINITDQGFEEGSVVEVDTDSVVKLGKPRKKLYTTRLINIFKMVLADMDKLKEKHGDVDKNGIFAYTDRNDIPNILRWDIEGLIEELE